MGLTAALKRESTYISAITRTLLGGIEARLPQIAARGIGTPVPQPGKRHSPACVIDKSLAWSELGQHS